MVFFRTRLGKILIWQKFSQTWGSHLKTQPTFSRPRLKQMIDLVTWPGISGSLWYLAETVKLAIFRYEGTWNRWCWVKYSVFYVAIVPSFVLFCYVVKTEGKDLNMLVISFLYGWPRATPCLSCLHLLSCNV